MWNYADVYDHDGNTRKNNESNNNQLKSGEAQKEGWHDKKDCTHIKGERGTTCNDDGALMVQTKECVAMYLVNNWFSCMFVHEFLSHPFPLYTHIHCL